MDSQEAILKCSWASTHYFYTCTVKEEEKKLHYMRVTLQISGLKKRKKEWAWMYSIYGFLFFPLKCFQNEGKVHGKRYLSMTVELELVKATKYRCQNPFCSVTQPKPGRQVTLNTYINVWTHGDDIEIFTFRYTGGPLSLILTSEFSSWHNFDISFLKCQPYIGNIVWRH